MDQARFRDRGRSPRHHCHRDGAVQAAPQPEEVRRPEAGRLKRASRALQPRECDGSAGAAPRSVRRLLLRELHENPKRRIGWRFEDAFEEKSDCGDFENLSKDCFEFTESGWMEVEDPDVLDSFPDIDESDGTFATLTGEPFAWATEIEFRSPKSRRSGRPVAVPTRTAARHAALRRSSRVGSEIRCLRRARPQIARRSRKRTKSRSRSSTREASNDGMPTKVQVARTGGDACMRRGYQVLMIPMSHPHYHSKSSASRFGGVASD